MKSFLTILTVGGSLLLSSCGSSTAVTTYAIGGTISGLNGTGLVLQYNSSNNLAVSAGSTTFTFANAIATGGTYTVAILTQPSSPVQTCAVTSGASGTATSTVISVQIVCANNTFTIGGAVSGLSGTGLMLQDNGGSNLSISANGNYTFPTAIPKGSNFNITVASQPTGPAQTCGVTNGFGTNLNGNITDIQITCFTTTVTYTIGGTVSGLSGTGLVLLNNSGNSLSVASNGGFTFTTAIASGSTYSVTVLTQPSTPAQNCVVAGGGGTASANITGVQVNCTTITETIGGTISGLTGAGLVLQDNGGDNLPLGAGATTFVFATQVASGSNYAATVLTQPVGQTCSVTNGDGTVTDVAVTNLTVSCSTNDANISVTVSGLLPNTNVVLQDNGADNLTVSTGGTAAMFHTSIASGAPYAVTVLTQPAGATCTVGTSGSGTLASDKINVAVSCGNIIAAGGSHTCAVTSAGAVLCWGLNEYGQLGDGKTADSTTPVPVVGLSGGVVSIAAGEESTCALTNAGAVWCWGNNANGQLGNGTLTQSSVPVEVLDPIGNAPLSGVAGISAGQYHTCAVTIAAAALCWGDNSRGELGNAAETGSNLPLEVLGLSSGVAEISAGSYFTCAVTSAEEALCWGEGDAGQLGNGNAASSSIPAVVLDSAGNAPLSGTVAISASFEDACALTTAGTALCWGANNAGQLGTGAENSQSALPVEVLDSAGQSALNNVVAINGGLDDSCAVTSAGAILCWGRNEYGQLGGGNTTNAAKPQPVSGLSSGVVAIATGYHHTCAVTDAGATQCWGSGLDGQLDNGSTASSSTPVSASAVGDLGLLQLF